MNLPAPPNPHEQVWGFLGSKENYALLRHKLIRFFNGRRCLDAAELADDVMMRVIQAGSKDRDIRDLQAFAFGIAKKVHADWVVRQLRQEHLPSPPLQPSPPSMRAVCLERCLRQLAPDQRELLEAFFVDRQRAALALALGISPNALRIRIHRLKRQLSSCTDDCLEAQGAK